MGDDGKPYKTREGTPSASKRCSTKRSAGPRRSSPRTTTQNQLVGTRTEQRQQIAEVVGIGGAQVSPISRRTAPATTTFSYDKMLPMNGNTATYMQYAYARVRSIFRQGGLRPRQPCGPAGRRSPSAHPAERALGIQLLRFAEALADVEADYMPHHLTAYLFDLAKSYSTFFENCPVLKAETDATRNSRLLLCDLTARTIRTGLDLLGIQVVEKM